MAELKHGRVALSLVDSRWHVQAWCFDQISTGKKFKQALELETLQQSLLFSIFSHANINPETIVVRP